MTSRQTPWPREWLMTDERLGDRLWRALEHLPDGRGGIVLRHYSLPRAERARIGFRIAQICRPRGLVLAIGADEELAAELGADLVHNPRRPGPALPFSKSVHSMEEALAARDAVAALVFISPVHHTLSHPDQAPLGPVRAIELARAAGVPAIALGGMTEHKFGPLEQGGFYGWAGIGAWDKASG